MERGLLPKKNSEASARESCQGKEACQFLMSIAM